MRFGLRAIVLVAILFVSTTANALSISAEFNLADGFSVFANPVTQNNSNNISVSLTPGDIIALNVVVENPAADLIIAIFASLDTDSTQLRFLGGAFSNILTEATCTGLMCSPATLTAGHPAPTSNINDPRSSATGVTDWVHAVVHTNLNGAAGIGPDSAVILAYEYTGLAGDELVEIRPRLVPGDLVVGATGPINFTSALINVPAPSSVLLLGLGLLGLGSRRRPI